MKKELQTIYEKICQGTEVRANLTALKQLLGDPENRKALAYGLGGDFSVFTACLFHEDPKVRKNAALVLGTMECDDLVPVLLKAHREETTLFVKSAYLKALKDCDYEEALPYLRERLKELDEMDLSEENRKHYQEEAAVLQQLLMGKENRKHHTFNGFDQQIELILLTNREQREVTRKQLEEENVTMLAGGLRFFTYHLEKILPIRTYKEWLLPVRGLKSVKGSPWETAEQLAEKTVVYLEQLHEGKAPFRFRTELKSSLLPEKKASWVKAFSAALEKASRRKLVNSISDYEVEIRLIAGKDGSFVPLLKLFTLQDTRFFYRKETVAASMAPDRAALLAELASPYLREGAQVLDPFCGVGTLLIERAKKKSADPLYGLDIFEEAVEKARINAEAAGIPIHYINRDMRDFRHEYLFDEIFTDLPLTGRNRDLGTLRELYEAFLNRVPELLKKDGMLFLYTSEENILLSALRHHRELKIEENFLIQKKTNSRFYILRYEG